jgi:branched-chain amino acid transport system substrate-binding protein
MFSAAAGFIRCRKQGGMRMLSKQFRMLLCVVVLCMMPGHSEAGAVRIGLMCPLTGSWASEGQDMHRIVSLLAAEVNKAGGINGSPVDLVVEDDGGNPRSAVSAARKLVAEGVVAVIGTYGSAVTEASQNILNEAGILQIGTGSTSVNLTEKRLPYFFRTCPRDDEQGRVAARFIRESGYRNIAVLHDNSSYARGLAEETVTLLVKDGLKIAFFDALTPKERDYSAVLTRLRAASPDIVFFTGYYPEAGRLLRQKREMGWEVPMMGGDAANNSDLVKIAGTAAAAGFRFISPLVPADLTGEQGKAFLAAYRAEYRTLPQSVWAVLAGDAFNVLVEALRHTRPAAAEAAAYMKNELKSFSGITGVFSFDAKGDRVGDLYRLYRVDEEGKFKIGP